MTKKHSDNYWPHQHLKWETSDGRMWDSFDEAKFQQQRTDNEAWYKEYWQSSLDIGSTPIGPDRLARWIRCHRDWVLKALNGKEPTVKEEEIPF